MSPDAVRSFLARDRQAVEDLKRAHHARRLRAGGPGAGLELSWALWQHARAVRPDWPSAAERRADLAHHIDLKRRLERARLALAAR